MATIAEIRTQYPQYADMPDAVLADALYKKFYSDIPRATFDVKLLLLPKYIVRTVTCSLRERLG